MKKLLWMGILLSSCAASQQTLPEFCESQQSYRKGLRDAEQGQPSSSAFSALCDSPSRVQRAYREGYAAGRLNLRQKNAAIEGGEEENRFVPVEAGPAWICEVEASHKIFTGVGETQEQADQSAKETCGAHFQSSFCVQTECRPTHSN